MPAPRTSLVIGLGVTALALVLASCTPRDAAVDACLDGTRPLVTAPAHHDADTGHWPGWGTTIANGTAIEARGSTFGATIPFNGEHYVGIKMGYRADSRHDVCLVGGTVYTTLEPENTPWSTWHEAYAVSVDVPDFHAIGTRVLNHGDAFALAASASNWTLTGVAVDGAGLLPHGYAHDDCVQNDGLNSGTIVDAKFDGCYVFFSHQDVNGNHDGTGRTVTITDTLVYLRPYHSTYKPDIHGYDQIGPFFKTRGPSVKPQLVIDDSIFRADQEANFEGLALPAGTDCGDVVLIGTEEWPADELATWQTQCDSITYGTAADWDTAVAAWDQAHPALTAGA